MMSIQQQARALMSRHHQLIRNREQSMLLRTVAEVGIDIDVTNYHSHIQGKTINRFGNSYDRSHTAMS
jgi:propanediol utilization protein